MIFLTLIILYIVIGLILNKFTKGESPEIFLEIPPYRRPNVKTIRKKTWMRVRWFLKDAIPWLILGVFFISVLDTLGVIDWLGVIFEPVMGGVFGLPGAVSIVLLTGFLRKDLAVGLLLALTGTIMFNPMQLVIVATMLTIYFPCVATFAVLIKELGFRDMIKSAVIMVCTAGIVGFILRVVLLGV